MLYLLLFIILFHLCYKLSTASYSNYNPIITIAILACNRYIYLYQALNSLFNHLIKYEKNVNYNILYFDQGTAERYEIVEKYNLKNTFFFNPSGMELSFDALYSYLYTQYVLLLEEDWVIHKNVESEIFHPSFILESILILSQTNKVYGIIIRDSFRFILMNNISITTKMGRHTLFIGLLAFKYAYTNGASIYRTKDIKKIKKYNGEKKVSDFYLKAGYKVGFTYKGRKGKPNDIHDQSIMDHIGINTSKSYICSKPLY